MNKFLILLLYCLVVRYTYSSSCQIPYTRYDQTTQSCIQCNDKCETCQGPRETQCITCRNQYYLNLEDRQCLNQCPQSYFQNESEKYCIQCQIKGCKICDKSQQCLQCEHNLWYDSAKQLCVLNDNICQTGYYYNSSTQSCFIQCNNNLQENKQSKVCEDIQICDSVSYDSQHRITEKIQKVQILNNSRIVLFAFPCRFYISSLDLQTNAKYELIEEAEFQIPSTESQYISFENSAGCISKSLLIIYDFNGVYEIFRMSADFSNYNMKYNYLSANIIIFEQKITKQVAFLYTDRKQFFSLMKNNETKLKIFLINLSLKLFTYFVSDENKSFLIQTKNSTSFDPYYLGAQVLPEFNFCEPINDAFRTFYCFTVDSLQIYQIYNTTNTVVKTNITSSSNDNLNTPFYSVNLLAELLDVSQLHQKAYFLDDIKLMILLDTQLDLLEDKLIIYNLGQEISMINLLKEIGFGFKLTGKKDIYFVERQGNQMTYLFIPIGNILVYSLFSKTLSQDGVISSLQKQYRINLSKYDIQSIEKIKFIYDQLYIFYFVESSREVFSVLINIDWSEATIYQYTTESYTNQLKTNNLFNKHFPQSGQLGSQNKLTFVSSKGGNRNHIHCITLSYPLPQLQSNQFIAYQPFYSRDLMQNQGQISVLLELKVIKDQKYLILFTDLSSNNKIGILDSENMEVTGEFVVLQITEIPEYKCSENQAYLLIPSLKLLYDMSSLVIISEFSVVNEILGINIFFDPLSQIILFIDKNYNLFQFELISANISLLYSIQNVSSLTFQLTSDQKSYLSCNNNIYLIKNQKSLISFSLGLSLPSTTEIELSIFEGNLDGRIVSLQEQIYAFLFDRIQIYDSTLLYIESISLNGQVSALATQYLALGSKFIIFGRDNTLYRFDINSKKLATLIIQTEFKSPSSILFIDQYYFSYASNVISLMEFQVVKQLSVYQQYEFFSLVQTETNSILISFSSSYNDTDSQLIIKNFNNKPRITYQPQMSTYLLIHSVINQYNVNCYYINSQPSQLIIVSLLKQETSIISYDLNNLEFDLIKVDLQLNVLLFSKENNLKQLNFTEQNPTSDLLLETSSAIKKLIICPELVLAIALNSNQDIIILNYQTKEFYEINSIQNEYLEDIEFEVDCQNQILFTKTPYFKIYSLNNGLETPIQPISETKEQLSGTPVLFNYERQVFGYFGISGQATLINGSKSIKILGVNTQAKVSQIFYDFINNFLIHINGIQRLVQVFNGLTGALVYTFKTSGQFANKPNIFSQELQVICILDQNNIFYIFKYKDGSSTQFALQYNDIKYIMIDENRGIIFLQSDYHVNVHQYPSLNFKLTIVDSINSSSLIIFIDLVTETNMLIVQRQNSSLQIYDLEQIVYEQPKDILDNMIPQFLVFNEVFIVVFNIKSQQLSLFENSIFRSLIEVKQTYTELFRIGKFFKLSSNSFVYWNSVHLLLVTIDFSEKRMYRIKELILEIDIEDVYYDLISNSLYLIDSFKRTIYKVELNFNPLQISVDFNSSGTPLQNGMITVDNLLFYEGDKLLKYNLTTKSLDSLNIGTSSISTYLKLSSIEIIQSNRLFSSFANSNQGQNDDYLGILIISNSERTVSIIDSEKLLLIYSITISFQVINAFIDFDRQIIFLVGDLGYTLIANYKLVELAQIANPCLGGTRIQTDEFYIYSMCSTQLLIFDKITLALAYPRITGTFQNLHSIFETKIKGIFFINEISKLNVVRIQGNGQIHVIYSKIIKGVFSLSLLKVYSDSNNNKRLKILGITFFDVIFFDIGLSNLSKCSQNFVQEPEYSYNNYLQNVLQKNQATSSQLILQLNIEVANWQAFKKVVVKNGNQEGVKVRMYSSNGRDATSVSWWDSDIITSDVQITTFQIDSVSIMFNWLNLVNYSGNIKQMILQNIYVQSGSSIRIFYLEELYIFEVRLINYQWQSGNPVFYFNNCTSITINTLVIENSVFNDKPVFYFENVGSVKISSIVVLNSKVKGLFQAFKVGQFSLSALNLNQVTGTAITDSILKGSRVDSFYFGNAQLEQVSNLILVELVGCLYSQVDQVTINNSSRIIAVKSNQFIDENSNNIVSNTLLNMNTMVITNCQDIQLKIIHKQFNLIAFSVSSGFMTNGFVLLEIQSEKVQITNSSILNMKIVKPGQLIRSVEQEYNNERNLLSGQQNSLLFSVKASSLLQIDNLQVQETEMCFILSNNLESTASMKLTNIIISKNVCSSSLVKISKLENLIIENSKFENNISSLDGGALTFISISKIDFSKSYCNMNSSTLGNGGCIYALDVKQFNIDSSSFLQNESQNESGGCIYMAKSTREEETISLKITESTISQNYSKKGKGGGIYLLNSFISMYDSNLTQNQAAIGGGMFYANLISRQIQDKSIYSSNIINGNKAVLYGQNVGSTPRKIHFVQAEENFSFESDRIIMSSVQSGGSIQFDGIQLLDEEDNPVGFSQIQLFNDDVSSFMASFYLFLSAEQTEYQITDDLILIEGGLISKNLGYGYSFNFTLSYRPFESSGIKIESPMFEALEDEDGLVYLEQKPLFLHFQASFRECKVGEIMLNSTSIIRCFECPDGKYSINRYDKECTVCPSEASSCSGSTIALKDGYWRQSNDSDTIVICENNPSSCSSEIGTKYGCVSGYEGPVCEKCSYNSDLWGERYSNLSGNTCESCNKRQTAFLFKWIAFMVVIFVQINFAVSKIVNSIQISIISYYLKLSGLLHLNRSVEDRRDGQAYKILIDHIQVLTAASAFQLQIPNLLSIGTDVLGNPSNISNKSLDCFWPIQFQEFIPLWVFSFIWSISLPLMMVVILILYQQFKRSWRLSFFPSRYYSTIACSIYLHYLPSIVMLMTKCLNCRVIGGVSYSQIDLGIECSDYENHLKYVLVLVIPILFLVCAILPLVLALLIRSQRMSKKSYFDTTTLRFLYDPYIDKYFFWDQIKLFMKSIIMISSILMAENQNTQTRVICGILFIYLVVIQRILPYKRKIENFMDKLSMVACIITLLISNISYQSDSQILVLIISFFIIIINGSLVGYLLMKIFIKQIPIKEEERSIIQKLLMKFKIVFPGLELPMQKIVSFKSLRKFSLLKRNIPYLIQQHQIKSTKNIDAQTINTSESSIDIIKDSFIPCESQSMNQRQQRRLFFVRTSSLEMQSSENFNKNVSKQNFKLGKQVSNQFSSFNSVYSQDPNNR